MTIPTGVLPHEVTVLRHKADSETLDGLKTAVYEPDGRPTPAFVQEDGRTEIEGGVIAEKRATVPASAVVTERDRIRFDGRDYHVLSARTPRVPDGAHHQLLHLRAVESPP